MEDKIIIRFANENETFIGADVIKEWDIVFRNSVGDTHFCSVGDLYFSINSKEIKNIPKDPHYRPTPEEVGIRRSEYLSEITGRDEQGLFANEFIKKGTMWMTHVKTYSPVFEDGFIRLPMGGFFNHNSKDPNCRTVHIAEYIYLEAIRDINKDEELTSKYTLYDPEEK